MAYLDTSHIFSQFNAIAVQMPADFLGARDFLPARDPIPAEPEIESFEPVEWAVISLARHDGLATLNQPRRSKLGRILFGQQRTYNLSGERLEALRWLAVEAWHQPLSISLGALGGFIAAGFSSAQLALLLGTTGALRAMAGQTAFAPTAFANAVSGNSA